MSASISSNLDLNLSEPFQIDFNSAKAAYDAGDFSLAEKLCRRIVNSGAKSVPATVLLANICSRLGRVPESVDLMRRVLSFDPDHYEAHLHLAFTGFAADSIVHARIAVGLRPEDPLALNALARCHLAMEEPREAAVFYRKAIEIAPTFVELYVGLGDSLLQLIDDGESIQSYQKALDLNPTNVLIRVRLARGLRKQLRSAEATIEIGLAKNLAIGSEQTMLQLGRDLYGYDFHIEAADILSTAKDLWPTNGHIFALLGSIYRELGRFDLATLNLSKAIELDPTLASAYLDLMSSRTVTLEDKPLLERMKQLLYSRNLSGSARSSLHYALGKAHEDLGDYRKAMQHFDEGNGLMQIQLGRNKFDKGRQTALIDWTIRTFSREFIAKHQTLGDETERPLFIVGMIRSGTTLLEQIVSSHPDIAAGGEQSYLFRKAERIAAPLDKTVNVEAAREISDGYLELLKGIDPSSKRVTDKMPHNFLHLGLIHILYPNARLIHCKRNPLDTCISIFTTYFRDPIDIAHDKDTIAFFYGEYVRLMEHWKSVLPADRLIEVEYESLIADREAVVERLIEFCGLAWDERCLRHEANERAIKTPSWWQARQPVYSTSIGRWKRYEPWLDELERLRGA